MRTEWTYRMMIIVPEATRETTNALWTTLFGEEADSLTFGVPLSEDGFEPTTHRGCNTAARMESGDAARAYLRQDAEDWEIADQGE